MCGYVNQHMQPPGSEFPHRPLSEGPDDEKHSKEADQAMRHVVEIVHILRNGRLRRRSMAEVWSLRHAERDGEIQDSEGQEIRRQAEHKGQPKAWPASAPERDLPPQSVGKHVHCRPPCPIACPSLRYQMISARPTAMIRQ